VSNDVFLKFDYGARDIFDATRLRVASRLRGRAALVVGGALGVAAAVFLLRTAPAWLRVLGAWLVAIAAVQWGFSALRRVPHAMFRKSAADAAWTREARSDFWNRKMSVDASDEGIVVTVGRRTATLKWRDCAGLESDRRCHLVRVGATGFLAVPRRAFRNEKKDADFRALATRFIRPAEAADERAPAAAPVTPLAVEASSAGEVAAPEPPGDASPEPRAGNAAPAVASARLKVGRNDPCPCGSGKKYKKCCLPSAGSGGA
jgi:hypothetical protein